MSSCAGILHRVNFTVGFVLRLQPNLVHFANADLIRDGNNKEQGLYILSDEVR